MRNTQQHATTTVGTSYLRVADDANDLAVFLNTIEVLVQLFSTELILPLLAGLGERLLLGAVPTCGISSTVIALSERIVGAYDGINRYTHVTWCRGFSPVTTLVHATVAWS